MNTKLCKCKTEATRIDTQNSVTFKCDNCGAKEVWNKVEESTVIPVNYWQEDHELDFECWKQQKMYDVRYWWLENAIHDDDYYCFVYLLEKATYHYDVLELARDLVELNRKHKVEQNNKRVAMIQDAITNGNIKPTEYEKQRAKVEEWSIKNPDEAMDEYNLLKNN